MQYIVHYYSSRKRNFYKSINRRVGQLSRFILFAVLSVNLEVEGCHSQFATILTNWWNVFQHECIVLSFHFSLEIETEDYAAV